MSERSKSITVGGVSALAGAVAASLVFGLGPKLLQGGEQPTAAKIGTETALDVLNRQLAVAELAGPTATKWASCPMGEGVEALPAYMRVNAFQYPDAVGNPDLLTPNIEIDGVIQYRDEIGVVAYCGKSVGKVPNNPMTHPPKGQVIVIPNDPSCPVPRIGQEAACSNPVPYDTRSVKPGPIPLGNSVPSHAHA